MKITLEIPDTIATETIDAYCEAHGYEAIIGADPETGRAIPNPLSKVEFLEERLAARVMNPAREKRLAASREEHRLLEAAETEQVNRTLKAKVIRAVKR